MTINNLPKKKLNTYLKYSGVAFQMAAVVLIGYFVGNYIDEYFRLDLPFVTILLILSLFSGYMYKLYIELVHKDID